MPVKIQSGSTFRTKATLMSMKRFMMGRSNWVYGVDTPLLAAGFFITLLLQFNLDWDNSL